jgi:hypothetical protein
MNDRSAQTPLPPPLRLLEPDETVEVVAVLAGAKVLVTDRRLAVATEERVALDVGFETLRRIQFDIERTRPATLVIVPENPSHEPQVLGIPVGAYDEVTRALAIVGRHLAEST